ncbi:hypothetical protein LY28_02688 [Ruminiclostridium sufflavum DSM 19573]|uniref:Uncharacterized protein n=1 Tax=Ruminiclostridium sufflavum DSM 19573 TaxID=1121337 RepID=A0A318XVM5_9FIRM|nr:hypothetical protein [Ruminiclostridium sufflavum]PYG86867.1 hypothetical protein LY28_02688 [Ruminiclostridium sufflavum DSM 19573]
MNKNIEQFYEKYGLFEKEYLPEEEQERLNALGPDSGEKAFGKYGYEPEGLYEYRFYRKIPPQLTDLQLNNIVLLKLLEKTEDMNSKQNTIKNILIFWLILTVLGVVIPLLLFAFSS